MPVTVSRPCQDNLPIAALATQWDFADSAHFARSLRQAYGTSPSQWRAAH
ncbi:MAG TPA: AraC family transcriptional regulator [Candidatus Yaniella excrementigallinarum]|nr:AraC family transcriptional regulator [Candidatus Yaniella excrementigallinarum]